LKLIRYLESESNQPRTGCVEGLEVFEVIAEPEAGLVRGYRIGHLGEIQLLAPCQPKKVVAVAINFAGIDGYSPEMSEPMVFVKPATTVCGPGVDVINPFPELAWWGEAELAVVVKDRLRNVNEAQAREGLLGFTIGNDTTVENVEGRDHHLARSKCPDSFCPLGPWIDTDFEADDCLIEAVQNGEVIRRARSSEQVWQWPKILSWLSHWMTLEPGDVVLTGNPPDTVGMRYLNHGDVYTARIAGLGELTNRFLNRGM
jgi:2-keto-4-pentenoate hydratase/2-oxohepta-3-ene-1,7-dioic acid hydratase in catechol pathway